MLDNLLKDYLGSVARRIAHGTPEILSFLAGNVFLALHPY